MPDAPVPPARETLRIRVAQFRGQRIRLLWTELALEWALGIGALVVIGALAFALGLPPRGVGIGVLATAAVFFGWRAQQKFQVYRRTLRSPTHTARSLDTALADRRPPQRVSVLSAVELATDAETPAPTELRDAAVEDGLPEPKLLSAVGRADRRRIWRRALPVAGAEGVALLILALAAPGALGQSLRIFSALTGQRNPLEAVYAEPALHDFEWTLRPPGYTERPTQKHRHPAGRIRGLPGSEVRLHAQIDGIPARAELLLERGDQSEPEVIAMEVRDRALSASWVLHHGGRYRIRVYLQSGERLEEARGHPIELEEDAPPSIQLLAPTESPLEVHEGDEIKFRYRARDDFRLGDLELVWRIIGSVREGRKRLSTAPRGHIAYAGHATVRVQDLSLKPGDRVAYSLEVYDNDTVLGPKTGASATQELHVYSKRDHHREVMDAQSKALEELVHLLGDGLELRPAPPRPKTAKESPLEPWFRDFKKVAERARKTDSILATAIEASRADPLGRPQVTEAFYQARARLRRVARRKRGIARDAFRATARMPALVRPAEQSKRRMVDTLERDAVYLADLLNDQRLLDAEALTKSLRAEQEALREALEAYRDAPSDAQREALRAAIEEIRQRMREIMKELAEVRGSIPTEFANQDALRDNSNEAQLDSLENSLAEGNLDAAMEALDSMLSSTEKMLAELQSGRQELGRREYSELQRMAQEAAEALQQIETEQGQIAEQTKRIAEAAQNRQKKKLKDWDKFLERQLKRLGASEARLADLPRGHPLAAPAQLERLRRRIADTGEALQVQDLGAAQEMLERALAVAEDAERRLLRRQRNPDDWGAVWGSKGAIDADLKAAQKVRTPLQQVADELKALASDHSKMTTPAERERLEQLQRGQSALAERTEELRKKLEELGQQAPVLGPEMETMLQEAGGHMRQAGDDLEAHNAPSAHDGQRQALDALGNLKQKMQQMQNEGSSGGGMPLPFGPGRPSGGGGGSGSGQEQSQEKVEIPKAEDFQAPTEFREDILEAAKQGTAKEYREAVQRYYEELIK